MKGGKPMDWLLHNLIADMLGPQFLLVYLMPGNAGQWDLLTRTPADPEVRGNSA